MIMCSFKNEVVMGSNSAAVTETLDIASVSNKKLLDIQATIECKCTLKRVRGMIIAYSQMSRTDNNSKHCLII